MQWFNRIHFFRNNTQKVAVQVLFLFFKSTFIAATITKKKNFWEWLIIVTEYRPSFTLCTLVKLFRGKR